MQANESHLFRVTGRGNFSRIAYVAYFGTVLILFGGMATSLLHAERFGNISIIPTIVFGIFGLFFFKIAIKGTRMKTIEIDETGIRFYVKNRLKKRVMFQDVTMAYSLSGFNTRIILVHEKDWLLYLDLASGMKKNELVRVFYEICRYSKMYGFEVQDHFGRLAKGSYKIHQDPAQVPGC